MSVLVGFRPDIDLLFRKHAISTERQARITVIQQNQAQQAKSSCNETRKDRLLTALFRDFTKFSTTVDMYRGVLSKF